MRRPETRLKEHKEACLRGEQEKSAVADRVVIILYYGRKLQL